MTEENSLLSSVKVKDLIAAFENKKSSTSDYPRPRARSLGDLLSKNVVVRLNQSNTFEDIEEALKQFDKKLSQYESYKKEQHVTLQNEVFNILTSIVSVKSDEEKKRYLITNTQRFVALLNKKLPSNNSTSSSDEHKYITYDRYRLGKTTRGDDNKASEEPRASVNNEEEVISISKLRQHYEPRVTDDAKNKRMSITNEDAAETGTSVQEEVVSITKLREHFEPRTKDVIVKQRTFKSDFSLSLRKPDMVDSPIKTESRLTTTRQPSVESPNEPVSVSKLRNLFDKERQSEGLGGILRTEHTKFKFRVIIPYNARREPVRTPQNSRGIRIVRTTPEEEPADSESSNVSDSDLDDDSSDEHSTKTGELRIQEIALEHSTDTSTEIIKGPSNNDSDEVRYGEPIVVSVGAFGYVEGNQEKFSGKTPDELISKKTGDLEIEEISSENSTEIISEINKGPSENDSDEVRYEEPIVVSVGAFGYVEGHQEKFSEETSDELISKETGDLKIEEISSENSTEMISEINKGPSNNDSDEVRYEEPIVVSVGAFGYVKEHQEKFSEETSDELISKETGDLEIEKIPSENSTEIISKVIKITLNDDSDEIEYEEPIVVSVGNQFGYVEKHQENSNGETSDELSTKAGELEIGEISSENSTEKNSQIIKGPLNESSAELISAKMVGSVKVEEMSLENSPETSSGIIRAPSNDDSGSETGSSESYSDSTDSVESVKSIKNIR
ncbi:unnamed protein product [Phaedon cochleariae]|uniref:Uncharacterized protein n=1 Tax=Phaedon cochleariae TaxID=80249 RepID=A0A9P0DLF6_PHACE|nr:unnamed protein product [Phaedon cochleariae]